MKTFNISLLGCGNIGGATWLLLDKMKETFAARDGLVFDVKHVLVLDPKVVTIPVPYERLTVNADDCLNDPDIDIVIELLGGAEPSATYMERALLSGKHVVTANKMALALNWDRLRKAAAKGNAKLFFEASVAGAIPVIRAISDCLSANSFSEVMGIVNGTTNYILTRMAQDGMSYADALKKAQELHYAEPNPSADVKGWDAAYKLSILATLCFHSHITFDDIACEGIEGVTARDIADAKALGMIVKLLAIGKHTDSGISANVYPAMLPETHTLSSVKDSFNAVFVNGSEVTDMMFYGRGAGPAPTASAVISDVLSAAKGYDAPYTDFSNDEKPVHGTFGARYLRFTGKCAEKAEKLLLACGIKALRTLESEDATAVITASVSDDALEKVLTACGENGLTLESKLHIEGMEE